MPDTKITALAAITTVDPAADVLPIVDISDTSMAASGTTKKITSNQILGSGGTATFSTLTVSGAATAQRFIPSSATVPTNGMYLPAANELGWAINSAEAMRLNSTGLGVGYTPSGSADKIGSAATLGVVATGATADLNFRNSSLTAIQRIRYTDGTGVLTIGSATGTAYPVELGGSTSARAMTLDASGNLILQSSATPATLTVNGQLTVNATSNTNLRFSYRGSDGTTRVANITLA